MHQFIGITSGLFEFVGGFTYAYSIIKGKTKPSRATWFIWSLAGIMIFSTYYASGAETTLWQPAAALLWNITFALLSLKFGVGGLLKTDIFCFIGSLFSMLLWILTKNPVIALTCIVAVGAIGSIPTILKVYKSPMKEDLKTWTLWFLAAFLNVIAIDKFSYAIAVYPLECVIVIGVIFGLVARKKLRRLLFLS
ncbi:MAG: hypothetical protein WCT36_03185 [Candidatus Gracilibacteria bacterium]